MLVLVSLLAAVWGARGEPPGADHHVTAGAVIHFPADSTAEDKADAVQGLRYFATGTSSIVPHQLVVYPGPIVGSGHILAPAQVGPPAAIPVPGYGTQPAQVLPVPSYGSTQLPAHEYGSTQHTSVLYGGTHHVPQGGAFLPQGSAFLPQGGAFLPQGGAVLPQGGTVLPQVGGFQTQGGGFQPQGGSEILQQGGGGVLQQGGGALPQGGVMHVPFPGNQQTFNIPNTSPQIPYPSTQHTTVPGVAYAATHPSTTPTPYGTQPPHAIYQDGVKPLAPGFLFSTPSSRPQTGPSHFQDDHSHANVDLTYDSLGSSSSSHGDNYNVFHNLVSHTAPGGKITSPPPMKATTYGPPKSLYGLYARHRRPTHVVDTPHYHPVYKGVISPYYHYHHPHGPHRHTQSTVVLKPHIYQPTSPHKYASMAYGQQQYYHTPQSMYSATKPVYYPQSLLGSYAPTHGYPLVGKLDMDNAYEHDIGSGEAMMHGQDDTSSNGYSTIVGTYYGDSSRSQHIANKAPVIVYKGVRPPVRVYQKPEFTGKHLQSMRYYPNYQVDRADTGETSVVAPAEHDGSPGSALAPFQSNWMPINAPGGAVPAKAYEMEAPDLSKGRGNHQTQPQKKGEGVKGQVSSSTLDHPAEKYFHRRPLDESRAGEVYKGNSEEVVSAVVMVKQK